MNSFVDTNVSIAYLFSIDPFNKKSISIFNNYNKILWSFHVKNKCQKVFKSKLKILKRFFYNLKDYLSNADYVEVTLGFFIFFS